MVPQQEPEVKVVREVVYQQVPDNSLDNDWKIAMQKVVAAYPGAVGTVNQIESAVKQLRGGK